MGVLLLFALPLHAQNQTVTGVVVDASGDPVIGASIQVVNGTNGTITNIDGKFSIKVAPKSKLKVSFIGLEGYYLSRFFYNT